MRAGRGVLDAAAARRRLPGAGPRLGAGRRSGRAAGGAARPGGDRGTGARAARRTTCRRARAGAGDRADALRARGRRRPRRVLPPLPPRPSARAAAAPPAPPASAPPALGLGGARLGGGQAADRERPGGADPAPHGRPLGAARLGDGRERAARRSRPGADRRPGAGRTRVDGPALRRAIALRAVAGEIAAGRCDPGERPPTAACSRCREIGPWTVQCLGLFGRGDPDSLPAGDLIYLKLVGRLARLGRRATIEEVEEFFAPYAPFRGLAARLDHRRGAVSISCLLPGREPDSSARARRR